MGKKEKGRKEKNQKILQIDIDKEIKEDKQIQIDRDGLEKEGKNKNLWTSFLLFIYSKASTSSLEQNCVHCSSKEPSFFRQDNISPRSA